jgi:hypothetical protein
MSDLDQQFAMWSISPEDVRQIGNQVIAISSIEARGRASEITLQFPAAAIFDFASNNRLTRVRIYPDVNEARKAVGLQE